MTYINKIIQDNELHIKAGLNGNWYVFAKSKNKIIEVCKAIGKSTDSIYYRYKYKCYAIRMRSKGHLNKLKELYIKE